MRTRVISRSIVVVTIVAVVLLGACGGDDGGSAASTSTEDSSTTTAATAPSSAPSAPAGPLVLESDGVAEGRKYPRGLTCEGGDAQPPLSWSGVPADAAELVLLLEDLDAPGGTFTHLVVHGLPAADGLLDRERSPRGAVYGTNDFGETGYRGPCPPEGSGRHRYVFTLLAVAAPLELDDSATGPEARAAAEEAGVVAEAKITTFYEFGLD